MKFNGFFVFIYCLSCYAIMSKIIETVLPVAIEKSVRLVLLIVLLTAPISLPLYYYLTWLNSK